MEFHLNSSFHCVVIITVISQNTLSSAIKLDSNTGSVLLFTTIWVPLGIISLLIFFNKVTRVHRSFAGPNCFLFAIGISEFTTQILKMYVGRLRPNFYALCSFDVVALQCTADIGHQYEARQSFPSGHSSLSFCGMGVLMWFLLGYWIRICSNGGNNSNGSRDDVSRGRSALNHSHAKKGVFVALSPLAYSTFVAISRIVDNWHFPSDVLAGTIIGFSCATISYHLWFHPVFSDKVGCPIYHVPVPAAKDDNEEGISLTNHAV